MTTPSETAIKLACERAGVDHEDCKNLHPRSTSFKAIHAHARDIERLEPRLCVDPVRAEAERIYRDTLGGLSMTTRELIDLSIRRGAELRAEGMI